MANGVVPLKRAGFGATARRDAWWVEPALTFFVLASFLGYANWAAFQGEHYTYGGGGAHYLSPFYSPVLWAEPTDAVGLSHAWFGAKPTWWPGWLPFSPALLILPFPAGFRLTCYYYRGAYYKAFWASPLSCTVGKPLENYRGEASFPLIIQNIHRYFLYVALAFLFVLSYDAFLSMRFTGDDGVTRFGVGVGTIVLTVNVLLLTGYTLGCHSLRHLVGGWRNQLSKSAASFQAYECVSCLNRRHMLWAWMSLVWVAFSDVYVRMCSMGYWTDMRLF